MVSTSPLADTGGGQMSSQRADNFEKYTQEAHKI